MVAGIPSTTARLPVATIWDIRPDGAELLVPVRPAQAVHASFRHLRLLPVPGLENGVPLSRLSQLDSLIENALQVNNAARADAGTSRTVAAAYRAGRLPLPGAFLDLVA